MTAWKTALGRFGVWDGVNTFDPAIAPELERLGYGVLWLGGLTDDLALAAQILDATDHLIVAPAVMSIVTSDPHRLASSYQHIARAHPGRLLLGIGVGHREVQGRANRQNTNTLA